MTNSFFALTAVADRRLFNFVSLLVQHDVQVSGRGAMTVAAGRNHFDVVKYLIEQKVDIDEIGVKDFGNSRNKVQEGASLHKTAARDDVTMTIFLIEKRANKNSVNRLGRTPLRRAKEEGQEEAVRYLESIGAIDEGGRMGKDC